MDFHEKLLTLNRYYYIEYWELDEKLYMVSSIYSESDPATIKMLGGIFESMGGKRFCFPRSGLQTPGIDRTQKITRLEKKVWRKILIFLDFR